MKYLQLALVSLRGLCILGLVGWGLLQFRDHFVNDGPRLPWGVFIVLLGCGVGGAYAYAAKGCLNEIRKLKALE